MLAGKKWSSVWSPTGGAKGREGDRICKLVADNMNVTSFPNQRFPRGIMVSRFLLIAPVTVIASWDTSTTCAASPTGGTPD